MQVLIRQVQDLPRQYRRTNREWPSSPSTFMPRIVKQLNDMAHTLQVNILSKPQIKASPALHSQVVELFELMVLQTTGL